MIPKYSQIYEELPEDIFQDFRNENIFKNSKRKVIAKIDTQRELNLDLIEEIKEIAIWSNSQGLKGNSISKIKFEMPLFSEDIFSNKMTVSCDVVKKFIPYVGMELNL